MHKKKTNYPKVSRPNYSQYTVKEPTELLLFFIAKTIQTRPELR